MKKLCSFIVACLLVTASFANTVTTYKGSLYEIEEEMETFSGDNVSAKLTDNGGSYSISSGGFDNVQMDNEGNLSREGYVSKGTSNYFLLSGYIKGDSLVFRFGIATVAIDPEIIQTTLVFRGKVDNTTTLTQAQTSSFTISTQSLQISVSGTDEAVSVYDISGRCVGSSRGERFFAPTQPATVAVPQAGMYIVRVGNVAQKVVVR